MLARERQNRIEAIVRDRGAVTTGDLVERFEVSLETVRRDLLAMEQAGKLTRVHGGAVRRGDVKPFAGLAQRNRENSSEKEELALCAMQFISEGDVIGIDAGSTATFFARALKEHFSGLTVVTISLEVLEILRENAGIDVILCGGRFMRGENAFFGPLALEMLKSICVPKWFLFASTVSLEHGVCCNLEEYYSIHKQMEASAGQAYILADSSKFEQKSLLKLYDMNPKHIYVTDSGLPKELRTLYKENGMTVFAGGEE